MALIEDSTDPTLAPAVDEPGPPADHSDEGGGEPWWHSGWCLIVLAVALVFLGAAIGYAVTILGNGKPGAGSVDVGYLQDMRWHHDQAVQMSLDYLEKPAAGQDPVLRTIASEILLGQQLESGAMVQLLHEYGQPEANETGTAMAWMYQPVPVAQMPGLATDAQIAQLKAATGRAADLLYAQLMIDHHLGGIHMASYAVQHASKARVKQLSQSAVTGEESDIVDLQKVVTRLNS
jgi:uncharacterized protein (DUF305 family)